MQDRLSQSVRATIGTKQAVSRKEKQVITE